MQTWSSTLGLKCDLVALSGVVSMSNGWPGLFVGSYIGSRFANRLVAPQIGPLFSFSTWEDNTKPFGTVVLRVHFLVISAEPPVFFHFYASLLSFGGLTLTGKSTVHSLMRYGQFKIHNNHNRAYSLIVKTSSLIMSSNAEPRKFILLNNFCSEPYLRWNLNKLDKLWDALRWQMWTCTLIFSFNWINTTGFIIVWLKVGIPSLIMTLDRPCSTVS